MASEPAKKETEGNDQVLKDLREFREKGIPGESWDVYLHRRILERWVKSAPKKPVTKKEE